MTEMFKNLFLNRLNIVPLFPILLAAFLLPQASYAACSNPYGDEGEIAWASNIGVMAFCNGTDWISMAGASNVSTTDPRIGTIQANRWCVANAGGTGFDCTTNAPVTTEVDPKVGSLTNGSFCTTNGTTITCTNNAAAQRTALGLGTIATQNSDAVAITGGTASGLSLVSATNIYGQNASFTALVVNGLPVTGGALSDRITSGTTNVIASTNASVTFTTAGAQRMVIGSAGQIGIGTAAPGQTLDVSGTARITSNTEVSGTIKLSGTGTEGCNGGTINTLRINPATGRLQICRM